MNKQHIAGWGSARQLITSGMPAQSCLGLGIFYFFLLKLRYYIYVQKKNKKSQKHKAKLSDGAPRKGRVQALQASNPIKNVISMCSGEDAVPF